MTPPPPDAPREILTPWFANRLIPLDAASPPRPPRSDYDLNPGARTAQDPLREAAVLVALIERDGGLNVVLTRRAEGLSRHPGQIAFPGGRLEAGETAVAAALREAEEEIGLDRRLVRAIGLGDGYETITGFGVTPVVGFVEPGAAIAAFEGEVAEVFEAPFAWLMDPTNAQRHWRDFEGGRRYYDALQYGDRLIWGATAGMLGALRERLFG